VIGYIIRRVVQAVFITLGVTLLVFLLLHLLPGGPARAILGPRANAVQIAQFNHDNGLDQPIWVQYWTYVQQLAHLNFGYSYKLNQTVGALLSEDLPKTLVLVGLSYVVAIVIAIPLGIYQAVRRNRVDDYVLTGASFVFYSMPVFWLGIILIVIFSEILHLLPPEGPQGATVGDLFGQFTSLILPVVTLALGTIALFSRYMRSSTLENMVQDYVRTARAKGASNTRVLFLHVLRNALIPILTLIGLSISFIFSGALITEALFNYPGIGLLFWNAAITQDYPVILGVIVVTGLATVLGSLLADVLYAAADPRVRYTKA
jgi:peptide/nickel transport system permease protein